MRFLGVQFLRQVLQRGPKISFQRIGSLGSIRQEPKFLVPDLLDVLLGFFGWHLVVSPLEGQLVLHLLTQGGAARVDQGVVRSPDLD